MATMLDEVRSFEQAEKFLRDMEVRRIAYKTYVRRFDKQRIGVFYHETCIVEYNSDGHVWVTSGGYTTATTKDRINKLIPERYVVYQSHNQWFLCEMDRQFEPDRKFFDGMILTENPDPDTVRKSQTKEA